MSELQVERLSSPLSDGAGRNLRYEPLYDKIRAARFEEDSSLSRGIWVRDLKKADWGEVFTLCVKALEHETKDLQIVCWLCESLCHLQQWNGLAKSLDLAHKFCQNCWDFCYPNDDDYLEHRIRILDWFVDKMSERSLFMPIVQPKGIIQQSLDLSIWLNAQNFDFVARNASVSESKIQEAEKAGQITLRRFRTIIRQTSVDNIQDVQYVIDEIVQKIAVLSSFFQEKCGNQSSSFKTLNDNLSNIIQICKFAIDGRVKIADVSHSQQLDVKTSSLSNVSAIDAYAAATNDETHQNVSSVFAEENQNDVTNSVTTEKIDDDVQLQIQETVATTNNSNEEITISSCKDAYKAVEDLANFLIEADPQSPGPYLIKMISSWSGKPLPAVLDDIATGSSEGHKLLKVLSDVVRRAVV
jgi:type VI secretion system protein ImpA